METLLAIGINLLIGAALWGIGMLLRKPVHREGPRADKEVQVSSYGLPIPLLYGQTKTAMQLIWATNLREHKHEESVGKGGGGTVVTYTYSCSWAGTFGVAPDPAIFGERQLLKLWIDSKLALNKMADADKVTESGSMKRFRFYTGSMTQLPDPTMQAVLGAANVPAYRGLCYGVYNDLNVTPYGNRIPTIRALTGPGTAATPSIYDVEGFEGQISGMVYGMGMVMHPDGIHLVTGMVSDFDGTPNADGYLWQLVNTYTRKVISSRKYYPPDPHCTGVGDPVCNSNCTPFGAYNQFDVDEAGYIYVVSCEERGYVCKLDSQTFTIQNIGPEFSYPTYNYLSGIHIYVSKNPLYPYLWMATEPDSGSAGVLLIDRDTLANPFDANSIGYLFTTPGYDYATPWIAVNNSDGSCFSLAYNASSVYLSVYHPDGAREDHDITSEMPPGYDGAVVGIIYDSENNQIIIGYRDDMSYYAQLAFFDASSFTLNGYLNGQRFQIIDSWSSWKRGVQDGYLYLPNQIGVEISKIDVISRTIVDSWDNFQMEYIGNVIYLPYKSALYVEVDDENHYLQEMIVGRLTAGTALLSNIVTDICKRTGFENAELNVAQLTDEVKGYAVDEDGSARQSLEPLMEAFIFDSTEVDGVLEFIKRGGVSIATIPEDDLGACQFGADRTVLAEITDQNELNLPRRVQVFYPDINRKHEQGVQYYDRQLTDSKKVKDITTKILMDKDQAKQLAHISFKYDWTSMPVEFSVGPRWAKLRATDVVTLSKTEGDYRVLLLEGRSEGLRTTWKGVVESSSYISDVLGEQLPMPYEDVFFPGPSLYQLMDLPPLLESHDQAGVYMASGALFPYWTGCTVYVSKDDGNSWTFLKDISDRSVTGVALGALPDYTYNRLDEENSLIARWDMESDVLASKTTTEFWNGQAHYLLVGDEIVCAKDVVTNGDGTQTFGPPLIRGARGTEYAKSSHAAGERVIILSMATTYFATLDSSYLNQSYLYNGISHGDEWEDGSKRMFPTELRTLKPWAGVQAEGTRDESNNLTIAWRRRNRFGHLNPLRAGVEVPMSEATEAYEVDILDSGTVVRTITGLSDESASYTAVQQAADGLTPGDPIDCEIYQLSATTGRGWELAATV